MQITEVAAQLMARAEQRAEIAAQNIANASTPGYRRRVAFADVLAAAPGADAPGQLSSTADFTPGQLVRTDSPTDLGIAGEGFFAVRSGEATLYTRQGQFRRDEEGRLATAQGMILQSADGGDVTVGDAPFEVAADGIVTRGGIPLARIALVAFDETGLLAPAGNGTFAAGDLAARPAEAAMVRQGMLETSNVNMGDEMVAMMEAVRRAETGQRLVTTYDDLMGRALNLFGQQ